MAVKFYTHPKNFIALREQIANDPKNGPESSIFWHGFDIVTDPKLPIDGWTGRYILPNGEIVKKDGIRVVTPFVEYGPDDLDWLLYAGIVTEQRGMFFYKVDTTIILGLADISPMIIDRRMFAGMTS